MKEDEDLGIQEFIYDFSLVKSYIDNERDQ